MEQQIRYAIFVLTLSTMIPFLNHSKDSVWAVVTTIHYPTSELQKLVERDDLQVVVVADKKTPLDWYLKDCIFLSVEQQERLPFSIISLLPFNHYSRKNVGYLYAIQHGATIIYDTDDDNLLTDGPLPYLPSKTTIDLVDSSMHIVNPYAHFGHPTLWPRGYPLEKILALTNPTFCRQLVRPLVQQGIVDNDPDIDAIFRLTQGSSILFDAAHPIGLSTSTFAPFNSQNTFFHYDAFWGLLLPITPKFRVCDIWRGYWVQRLLWDIEATLCFLSPCAIQNRNEHNLMHDFADEWDLYLHAGKLISLLQIWSSDKPYLFERILELTETLINSGFYEAKERLLTQAWIHDLNKVGFVWPAVIASHST